MDKKLTDSEIVKALKELLKELKGKKQLILSKEGVKTLCCCLQNHLDLINRLQAENERLFADNQKFLNVMLWGSKKNVKNLLSQIKAEAYKEFAERLKNFRFTGEGINGWAVNTKTIDNLLKELVGE